MDFTGKRIVITGATSGIGLSLVRALVKGEDCHVCAVGRNRGKLDELKNNMGGQIHTITCDLKIPAQVDAMVQSLFMKTDDWPGDVDLFIANAGFGYYEKLEGTTWKHLEDIYALNVLSPIYTLTKLLEYKGGRIFHYAFMASGLSHMPIPGYSLYSSTKFAVNGFSRAYSFEKSKSLILSTIYPVAVRTPFYLSEGKPKNIPLLRQDLEKNTRHILLGLRLEKKYIYPSIPFRIYLGLKNFLPLTRLYAWIEKIRLKRWLKQGGQNLYPADR